MVVLFCNKYECCCGVRKKIILLRGGLSAKFLPLKFIHFGASFDVEREVLYFYLQSFCTFFYPIAIYLKNLGFLIFASKKYRQILKHYYSYDPKFFSTFSQINFFAHVLI